jgi:hypothetical protein
MGAPQHDFDAFLRMLRVMLGCGQPRDADAIAGSLLTVAGKRFTNRRAPPPRRQCCGALVGAARHGQPQQPCWTAAPERTLPAMCTTFFSVYRPGSKLGASGVADPGRPAGLPAGARNRQQPCAPARAQGQPRLAAHGAGGGGTRAGRRRRRAARAQGVREPLAGERAGLEPGHARSGPAGARAAPAGLGQGSGGRHRQRHRLCCLMSCSSTTGQAPGVLLRGPWVCHGGGRGIWCSGRAMPACLHGSSSLRAPTKGGGQRPRARCQDARARRARPPACPSSCSGTCARSARAACPCACCSATHSPAPRRRAPPRTPAPSRTGWGPACTRPAQPAAAALLRKRARYRPLAEESMLPWAGEERCSWRDQRSCRCSGQQCRLAGARADWASSSACFRCSSCALTQAPAGQAVPDSWQGCFAHSPSQARAEACAC